MVSRPGTCVKVQVSSIGVQVHWHRCPGTLVQVSSTGVQATAELPLATLANAHPGNHRLILTKPCSTAHFDQSPQLTFMMGQSDSLGQTQFFVRIAFLMQKREIDNCIVSGKQAILATMYL